MKVYYGIENVPVDYKAGACVALGVFDGLHQAHRRIIRETVDRAAAEKSRAMLITFEPHPRMILNGQGAGKLPILTTVSEKTELLQATGLDDVLIIKTDQEFLNNTESAFIAEVLVKRLKVGLIVVGYDYHFGRNRKGTPETLKSAGQKFGFRAVIVPPFNLNGTPVRSSLIRQLLAEGQIVRANQMLGWQYSFSGQAVRGSGRGRELGFPTANLVVESAGKLIPADGVYFVKARLLNNDFYGIVNIGVRLTFNESERVIELYLIDFTNKDLYGQKIRVTFLERLRDEKKFETVAALKRQMQADLKMCKEKINKIENETEVCFK